MVSQKASRIVTPAKAGFLIYSISCLLMTQNGSVKGVVTLAALNVFSMAIFWPSFQAWIAES
jgi:hypothetical protein